MDQREELEDLRMQCAQDTDELARLRRSLQATHQALLDARAAGQNAFVMAAAAHTYLAAISTDADNDAAADAWDALLAARRATTPSEIPATHVVVERAELERLREIADAASAYVNCTVGENPNPTVRALVAALDEMDATQ